MKVIAEIGFNHAGDMDDAQAMIRAAAENGADAVKFQTFRAGDIALPSSPHFEAIRAGELTLDQHMVLKAEADACGVEFMSTPFGLECLEMLEKVGVQTYKVASMDVTNPPLLKAIASTGKNVIISTGMASMSEIAAALGLLEKNGAGDISLLHCLSQYPAVAGDLNLSVLPLLRDTFGVSVGYSDHYPGIDACLAAYFHGAEVIETHFTLDTTIEGGDHGHSADPSMLKKLVDSIALFETMKGDGHAFFRNRPDGENGEPFRRGIHAAREIKAGTVITKDDLVTCRPQHDLTPSDMEWVVGMRAVSDIKSFDPVTRTKLAGEG